MRSQKGFTLVELAIVLVIIGIILGGVLQGREMINNAKIKRVVSQQKEIVAAIFSYQDRYNLLPGDDNNATAKWAAAINAPAPNGANGQINAASAAATINCANLNSEACSLWDHLRRAGFISGGANPYTNPSNAYGGQVGVGFFAAGVAPGNNGNWIQLTNIPAETAQAIDMQNDDNGNWQQGNIRGSAAYNPGTIINLFFRL